VTTARPAPAARSRGVVPEELARRHPMALPAVRGRVAFIAACLFGLAWTAVTLIGRPSGFFSPEEIRHVGGLPVAPPQIQRRIPPAASDFSDLERQIQELRRAVTGQLSPTPSPGQPTGPSPQATPTGAR
jgi:hypothetical protein